MRGLDRVSPPPSKGKLRLAVALRASVPFCTTFAIAFLVGATTHAADDKPWSYAPIRKPAVPKVSDLKWCRDGVDVYVLAKLDAKKFAPNPDADRPTLLRRATFDLTGLPPTTGGGSMLSSVIPRLTTRPWPA